MFNVNFTLLKAPRRQFHIGKKKNYQSFSKLKILRVVKYIASCLNFQRKYLLVSAWFISRFFYLSCFTNLLQNTFWCNQCFVSKTNCWSSKNINCIDVNFLSVCCVLISKIGYKIVNYSDEQVTFMSPSFSSDHVYMFGPSLADVFLFPTIQGKYILNLVFFEITRIFNCNCATYSKTIFSIIQRV